MNQEQQLKESKHFALLNAKHDQYAEDLKKIKEMFL